MRLAWLRGPWLNRQDEQTFRHVGGNLNIEVYAAGLQTNGVLFKNMRYIEYMNVSDIADEFDVVDTPGFCYPMTYDAMGLDCKLVVSSFENIPFDYQSGSSFRHIDKVSHVIAKTHMVKKAMMLNGVPEEKISVVYPGVDAEFFRPEPSVAHGQNVLFVGRLDESKGLIDLITAMKGTQGHLLVAGAGDIAPYSAYANRIGVPMTYVGFQSAESIRNMMAVSKMLVLPSFPTFSWTPHLSWIEQFGVVLIEAKACGLPVIVSDCGSSREIVVHGQDGYLVPARAWDQMHEYISHLLNDTRAAINMGREGRFDVETRFDSRLIGKQLAKVYQGVCNA